MDNLFEIFSDDTNEDTMIINSRYNALRKYSFLAFGMKSMGVTVYFSDDIHENEIYLSENLITELQIPLYCRFVLRVNKRRITLGPFIGILAHLTDKGLKNSLSDLKSYLPYYSLIGGVIAAFSLESVDPEYEVIESCYFYNPERSTWQKQSSPPFPAVVFNKCRVIPCDRWDFLSDIYDDKLFNYPTFQKWEMYQWLYKDPYLRDALPETILCTTPGDVLSFVKEKNRAFLKPVTGTFAKGVIEISYEDGSVYLRYQKRKNSVYKEFHSKKNFNYFFNKLLRDTPYLIQEAVDLLTLDGQVIDFRFIYIKNHKGQWEETGLFSRYGQAGSAVSNITAGGESQLGFNGTEELIPVKKQKDLFNQMRTMAKISAHLLEDRLVQCGNLGFDFGIDKDLKVWIIEINNEDPDHRIAITANEKDILIYTRLQNMLYAKFLAGF